MADDNRYESLAPHVMLYPHVDQPAMQVDKAKKPTGRKSYSATFLVDPEDADFLPLRKIVIDLVREHHPAKYATAIKLAQVDGGKATYATMLDALINLMGQDIPFSRGDDAADKRAAKNKDDGEFQRGKFLFKTSKPEKKMDGSALSPPALGGVVNGKPTDFNTAELRAAHAAKFFFGAEAFFEVSFATYSAGNGGVKAYLNMVFATGKGTPLASGGSPSERFGKHVGHVSTVNPMDDEIPY